MIFLLLFPFFAEAAWKEVWARPFESAPRTAFFDAANDTLIVAVDGAALKKVTLQGEVSDLLRAEGAPGPLRANDGRIYWALGPTVFSFTLEDRKLRLEGTALAMVTDLTLNGKGKLFVASEKGWGEAGKETGGAVTGLFALGGEIFSLRKGALVEGDGKKEKICAKGCVGLERAPTGGWITAQGNEIRHGKDVLVKGSSRAGRFAYVYRRDSKFDLIVVPYAEEKILRAYQRELVAPAPVIPQRGKK